MAKAPHTTKQEHEVQSEAEVEQQEAGASISEQAAAKGPTTGVRARRTLAMKQLLPDEDWKNVNVVAKGKGYKVLVGRVYGVVNSAEKRPATLPNGDTSEVTVCQGMFVAESFVTGEISEAGNVYFPNAFAEKMLAMFTNDANLKAVEVDCDIGLEATGKSIPTAWVTVQHIEQDALDVMKRLRNAREPERPAFPKPEQKALPGS